MISMDRIDDSIYAFMREQFKDEYEHITLAAAGYHLVNDVRDVTFDCFDKEGNHSMVTAYYIVKTGEIYATKLSDHDCEE